MGFGQIWFRQKALTDVLVGLASAALLLYLTSRASAEGRARGLLLRGLESPALVGLGHFSYSLYLTHLPVVALCYFGLRGSLTGAPLALALLGTSFVASLAVGYVFHLAVERRFIHK
jgi:peptidoglycan/LPS O-acetylase OafA/YrhL